MTILESCCCWKSVRRGSYVSAIYTLSWYTLNAFHISFLLKEEVSYFKSNNTEQPPASLIDHDTTSFTSVGFTIVLLFLCLNGIIASFILLYGLYKDFRVLLIPWIITMTMFILTDLAYVVYSFYQHALSNPITGILITIDLFLNAINIYALLCVISQYQEYKAGRGRASDELNHRIPNILYSCQPTATSYLSSRRAVTCAETRPTPTQSPSGTGPSIPLEEPSPIINNKGPRKSVKFPDHSSPAQNGSQLLDPWTLDVKSPMLLSKGADTAPLIESTSDPAAPSSV